MRKTFLFFVSLCVVVCLSVNASTRSSAGAPLAHPRQDATVTIKFDGLMAICFGNPNRVSAGILDVHHHTPVLTISKIQGEKKVTVAEWKSEELRNTLYVDIEHSNRSVSRYHGDSLADPNDFRHTVDFESDLYQKQLQIKEEKLFGKVHFSAGLFYADHLSDGKVQFFAANNSGQALPFNRRIAVPAAKLNLGEGALVISSSNKKVRLVSEPGIRYEIELTNLPPAEMANTDHFLFYYDIIGEKVTRFNLVETKKAAFLPTPLVCFVSVFGKSQLN